MEAVEDVKEKFQYFELLGKLFATLSWGIESKRVVRKGRVMGKAIIYRTFLVSVAAFLLVFALTPGIGYSASQDDAIFHFVGNDGDPSEFSCYYDLELGCHLEASDGFSGMHTYSINWVVFKVDLYYMVDPYGLPPISEHFPMVLDSDDFDLMFESLQECSSSLIFAPKGALANPFQTNLYTKQATIKIYNISPERLKVETA